jgi:predicted acylesterase/phospholipase RssA
MAEHGNGEQARPVVPGFGLCLASSFLGYYAHSGLLSALEQAGLVPERIAGSSAGAIAGGLFAAGVRGARLERLVTSFWFKRAFCDFGLLWRWPGVLCGAWGGGLFSGGRMRKYLRRRIGDPRIEELRDPSVEFGVANLSEGRSEVVKQGNLVDFLVASFAMPVVFTPQRIGGKDYLDGGVADETPFGHWLDDPAVEVIVVHTIRHPGAAEAGRRSMVRVLADAHRVVAHTLFEQRVVRARESGKTVLYWETGHPYPGLVQGRRAAGLVAAGRDTAESRVGGLRAALLACRGGLRAVG